MSRISKIAQYGLILLLLAIMGGCASSGKTSRSDWEKKRRSAARTNTAGMGRNKFFYSTNYQKRLQQNYRKKR